MYTEEIQIHTVAYMVDLWFQEWLCFGWFIMNSWVYYWFNMKKGAQIKSYLISHAKIRAGFKMWKQIDLYFHHNYSLGSHILYSKCVNLYLVKVGISLISPGSPGQSTIRCVKTASTRCVFKILNFSRFIRYLTDLFN